MAKRIGELLIEAKVITQEQLDHALSVQKKDGRKLGQVLVELMLVTETQVTQALSRQLSVPWVSLYHIEFSRSLLNLIPREVAEKYCLVPIFVRKVRKQGDALYVAMDDPTNEHALAEVAKGANMAAKPMIACPSDIRSAIRVYYQGGAAVTDSVPRMAVAAPSAPASAPSAPSLAASAAAAPPPPPTPPKLPERVKDTRPTVPEASEIPDSALASQPDESPGPPLIETLHDGDSPDADPVLEATEHKPKRRAPRMVGLTFLDGTTIMLPAKKKSRSETAEESARESDDASDPKEQISDQLTARDLISAFRAVAHGADASEILGERPPSWEAMFATLLSLMLKKGLIADWEFIEEFRKI